jgi:kinesin family protein 22
MVICNLAPGDKFAKEALRTLKFATRTREIENRPVSNAKGESSSPSKKMSTS